MISDAMLRDAAEEVSKCILENLPDTEACIHTFSKRFESTMRKVIHRAEHPVRYQVLRGIAAAVLAVIILFGSVFALSPTVRAVIINWFKEWVQGYVHYYSSSETMPKEPSKYIMKRVSDEWILLDLLEDENVRSYIYATSDNKIISFDTMYKADGANMFIPTEGSVYQSVLVNGKTADAYLNEDLENNNNYIVWAAEEEGVLFCIGAPFNVDELIAMAESVTKLDEDISIPITDQHHYEMTYIPDGCTLIEKSDSGNGMICTYRTQDDRLFEFNYLFATSIHLDIGSATFQSVLVNDRFAEAYIASDPSLNSYLVWMDEEVGVTFFISAPYELDELIKMAESVVKIIE